MVFKEFSKYKRYRFIQTPPITEARATEQISDKPGRIISIVHFRTIPQRLKLHDAVAADVVYATENEDVIGILFNTTPMTNVNIPYNKLALSSDASIKNIEICIVYEDAED